MGMIFYILFSMILLILCGIVAYNTYKNIPRNVLSFKESLDLVELPIVTFNCGKKKLNMILDTGATSCVLDSRVLETLDKDKVKDTNCKDVVYGIEGKPVDVPIMDIEFSYSGLNFTESFLINDMSAAFDGVKKESGVKIHGLIGSNFFTKNKYILDYNKMIFYSKK